MKAWLLNAKALDELPAHQRTAEIVLVMPATNVDMAQRAAQLMIARAQHADAVLLIAVDQQSEGFVKVANRCFKATQSRFFGYVAQDAYPGRRWLQRAHQTLTQSSKGLLGFNDGKWAGLLAAFGLGRRQWLAANYPDGNLFCPQYERHYADTEITALAMGNQQYCYDPHALMVELDWDKDHKPADPQDKALFAQRKQSWLPSRIQQPHILEMFN